MSFHRYSAMASRLVRSSQASALRPQGLTPLVEETPMAAFHFGSSKDKAAEIKAQEIKQSEGVDTLATGDFTGKKLRWYNEPYGIPGTRGIVPNTPRFKRMMKFQEEWSNSSEMVWKLRGAPDMALYYFLMAMMIGMLPYYGYYFYLMMYPKKAE